mmetsp:Transcript_174/g.461  ORF Transcript_174/g.461 Transcript_174/m.461 type:complete len:350 (-) Transcript_174:85-1134(-)
MPRPKKNWLASAFKNKNKTSASADVDTEESSSDDEIAQRVARERARRRATPPRARRDGNETTPPRERSPPRGDEAAATLTPPRPPRASDASSDEQDEAGEWQGGAPTTWAAAAALDDASWWREDAGELLDEADLAFGGSVDEADPLGLGEASSSPRAAGAPPTSKAFDAQLFLRAVHAGATFGQLEAGWQTLKARLGTQERKLRGVVRENLETFLRSAARLERFARALERLGRGGDKTAGDGPPASELAASAQRRVARHFGSLLSDEDAADGAEAALSAFRAVAPLTDVRRRMAAAESASRRALRARAKALAAATERLGCAREDGSPVAAIIHRSATAALAPSPGGGTS